MKTIDCWRELEPYGVVFLTGEKGAYMMRLLFDCTEKGRKILGKMFGIADLKLAEAWNNGSKEDPHVGSILLSTHMLIPVAVFALLEVLPHRGIYANGSVLGVEPTDSPERIAMCRKMCPEALVGTVLTCASDRHTHMMSGRVD